MALVTREVAYVPFDDATRAVVQVDFDDRDLRARAVRVVNSAPWHLVATFARTNGSLSYTVDGLPSTDGTDVTTEQAIQTNTAARLQFRLDAQGRLDDVEYTTRWQAP